MPKLDRILIYPIKSLDGVAVQSAKIMPGGSLQHDREFAIFDAENKVVNGKRTARIQLLRSSFDLTQRTITISVQQENPQTFHLDDDRARLEQWLSDYFGFGVHLEQNLEMGFPDDKRSPGPTIISVSTLTHMSQWFENVTLEEMRNRLRTNLEFADAETFWEDRLYGVAEEIVSFQIGDVQFEGVNPCMRCIVPTRDSVTAEVTPKFQQILSQRRQQDLPMWAEVSRFTPFYRAATNTRIGRSETGKTLRIGDLATISM